MSGITLEQAQAQLDALLAAQATNLASVSIAGRTVTYRGAAEIIDQINYWSRVVVQLQRRAAGESGHGFAVANLESRQ